MAGDPSARPAGGRSSYAPSAAASPRHPDCPVFHAPPPATPCGHARAEPTARREPATGQGSPPACPCGRALDHPHGMTPGRTIAWTCSRISREADQKVGPSSAQGSHLHRDSRQVLHSGPLLVNTLRPVLRLPSLVRVDSMMIGGKACLIRRTPTAQAKFPVGIFPRLAREEE